MSQSQSSAAPEMIERVPPGKPPEPIDLGWVKHLMEEEFNARDWREAQELALLALMEIQEHWGYCSQEACAVVAEHLGVELQRVYALVTFYGDLRTTRRGPNVYIACDGAACNTLGSGHLMDHIYDRLHLTQKGQTTARPADGRGLLGLHGGVPDRPDGAGQRQVFWPPDAREGGRDSGTDEGK
ncbi:MAG: NAD(P)H-dependent oxidoreductase subunit E [Thermomicrobiales bacterium]